MRGKRRIGGGGGEHDDAGGHGDRPWVFFMIDAFMLIVQFLVLNFKFKIEEVILPQKLPPGGTVPARAAALDKKELLPIFVKRTGDTSTYEVKGRPVTDRELAGTMASTVSTGTKFQVRVSYDREVPWGDVMFVFNECTRLKIDECGLVPLRGEAGADK